MVRFIRLKSLLYNLFSKGTRFDVLTPRTWTWHERSCWCAVTAVVGHKSRQRIYFYFYCQYSVLCLLDWVRPSLRWCWTTNCLRRWDSSAGLESRRNMSARSLKLWLTRSIRISLRRRYTATLVSGLDRVFLFFWSLWRKRMFCQTVWIDIVVLFFPRRLLCHSNCFSFAVDFYIFG